MWIKRTLVQAGIYGIDRETVNAYGIQIDDGTVRIGESIILHVRNVLKVLESPVEYEIQTRGAYINLSRTENNISTLIRC